MALDKKPDYQKTVLLLRDPTGDKNEDPYFKTFENELRVVFAPILDLQFCNRGVDNLVQYLEDQNKFSGIIFTSKNGVAAFEKAIKLASLDMHDVLNNTDIFAVGKTTEQKLTKWNTNILGTDCGNARKLSDFIIAYCKEKHPMCQAPFLFPCGEISLDMLPEKLSASGIPVKRCIVYKTTKHPDFDTTFGKIAKEDVDAVLFFSPSGVRFAYEAIAGKMKSNLKLKLIAFGESTAKELKKCFSQCDGVAVDPNPQNACNAVLNALRNN